MKFSLLFTLLFPTCFFAQFQGDWFGTLKVQGQELPLVLHLKESQGALTGTLDSPNQKAFGIPINTLEVSGKKLAFTIDKLQVSYQGTLSDSSVIVGDFKQGTFKASLDFNQQGISEQKTKKLQDPKEPIPYLQEEVTIYNPKGNFNLKGTLTHPEQEQLIKTPCVILITGSGPQDRNEEILGHRPFLVLADRLTRSGYGVLRMDDRGTGLSEGVFDGSTSKDFATDIESAIDFVKTLSYIDTQKIILMGHSEGGMIANMVAAKHPEVFGIVSLAGPGIKGSELLLDQQQRIAEVNGARAKEVKKTQAFSEKLFAILSSSNQEIQENARSFLQEYARKLRKKDLQEIGVNNREAWIDAILSAYANPWMLFFLGYEPMADLKKITCHYLALNGDVDLQVPAKRNLEAISNYCNPGPGKVKKIVCLPRLNHLFQPSNTGNPMEYGSNEITFDPSAIQEILVFLDEIAH